MNQAVHPISGFIALKTFQVLLCDIYRAVLIEQAFWKWLSSSTVFIYTSSVYNYSSRHAKNMTKEGNWFYGLNQAELSRETVLERVRGGAPPTVLRPLPLESQIPDNTDFILFFICLGSRKQGKSPRTHFFKSLSWNQSREPQASKKGIRQGWHESKWWHHSAIKTWAMHVLLGGRMTLRFLH